MIWLLILTVVVLYMLLSKVQWWLLNRVTTPQPNGALLCAEAPSTFLMKT